MRFHIGVEPGIDAADPQSFPPGHALNPQVNGLHWGWQGGYIYLALEGHYRRETSQAGPPRGFSYHLAGEAQRMTVEVPIEFDSRRHQTIELRFDLAKVLQEPSPIVLSEDGDSTHSREGDPLASRLKGNVEAAFTFMRSCSDSFQNLTDSPSKTLEAAAHGTPFPLQISQRFPKVALPEDNPLTREGVQLGERLFREPRLSKDERQSCASCHQRTHAFTDPGRRFSAGVEGHVGSRNAMPLFNLGWKKAFFWDGRAPTLREQVLQPIEDPHEMGASLDRVLGKLREDGSYPAMFEAAFAGAEISEETLAKALEQFLQTLISQNAKFDRAARGEARLTAKEQRGLQLFVTEHDPRNGLYGADCFHCHGGNLFTSHEFANNGLELEFRDLGLAKVSGAVSDEGKFSIPSLRNVAVTGPYMHDGRFATLEEVIEHYDSGVQRSPTLDPNLAKHPEAGLELSGADKEALVAFLRTLTDEQFFGRPEPLSGDK